MVWWWVEPGRSWLHPGVETAACHGVRWGGGEGFAVPDRAVQAGHIYNPQVSIFFLGGRFCHQGRYCSLRLPSQHVTITPHPAALHSARTS